MWRTVESNHADPALLITNPVILAACRAPFTPQFPCTVPLAYLGVGLRGDKEKRNSLYGQITDILILSFSKIQVQFHTRAFDHPTYL